MGDNTGTVRILEISQGTKLLRFAGHQGAVNTLSFSGDGQVLSTWGEDGFVRRWEVSTGRELIRIGTPRKQYRGLAQFSKENELLIWEEESGDVGVWDLTTGRERIAFKPHKISITDLHVSKDGKWLISHGVNDVLDNAALIGHVLKKMGLGEIPNEVNVTFSSDLKYPPSDVNVAIWDLESGSETLAMRMTRKGETGDLERNVSAYAFSADGRWLAWGGPDGRVHLREVISGDDALSLAGHVREVTSLVISSNGRTLVSGSADTTLLVWDLRPQGLAAGRKTTAADALSLEKIWSALAGGDVPRAYEAIWSFAADEGRAVPFIEARVRPVPVDVPERTERLIQDLAHDEFEVREKASRELSKLGEVAEAALYRAHKESPGPELRKRSKHLLSRIGPPFRVFPSESVRVIRVVDVLERIGSEHAIEVLRVIASGSPHALQTREAKAALARLEAREQK